MVVERMGRKGGGNWPLSPNTSKCLGIKQKRRSAFARYLSCALAFNTHHTVSIEVVSTTCVAKPKYDTVNFALEQQNTTFLTLRSRAIDPAIINARDEDGCDNVDHLRSVDTRRVYNFQRGGPTGIQNMVPTTERRSRRMAIRNLASRNKAGPGIGLSSQAASHASARSVSRHVPYIR